MSSSASLPQNLPETYCGVLGVNSKICTTAPGLWVSWAVPSLPSRSFSDPLAGSSSTQIQNCLRVPQTRKILHHFRMFPLVPKTKSSVVILSTEVIPTNLQISTQPWLPDFVEKADHHPQSNKEPLCFPSTIIASFLVDGKELCWHIERRSISKMNILKNHANCIVTKIVNQMFVFLFNECVFHL